MANLATELSRYIQSLTVGQGRHAGEPFKLLTWQRRFLRGAFADGVSDAALSVSRANGKSVLVAAIGAASVDIDAPLVEPMGECIIVAASFQQGLVIFRHIKHFLLPTLTAHGRRFRVADSMNAASILDRETGASVRVLGCNPKTMHGLQPRLIICDEVAQWEGHLRDSALSALSTSRGKIPDSRLIAIGTRPASTEHPFEKMLAGGADYSQVHAAGETDNPFRVRTWRKANPSLDHMPDLRAAIANEAKRAKQDATLLPQFEALRLNMGVSDVSQAVLIEASTWRRVESPETPQIRRGYVLGLDLGQNAAMSAASAYDMDTGTLDTFAVFPEIPSLAERGLKDGVGNQYRIMHERGELIVRGERVSSISGLLGECVRRWGRPTAIVSDRWREAELRQELSNARFPAGAAVITRGQGFKDGAEDVRDFRKAILDGHVSAPVSLLLRSAISEARVVSDPAGNQKIAKKSEGGRRSAARDDAIVSAVLAIAEGHRRKRAGKTRKRRRIRIGIAGTG